MFKLTLNTLYLLTVPTFVLVPFSAKPRPSKKAKLNKLADDNPATEPKKIPEQFEPNADVFLDDLPPQDHENFVKQMEDDPTGHAADPPSPAKAADKPPSPVKAADDKADDIMIIGVSHTTPGNPVALSKHSAKEEFSTMDKGKWNTDLSSYAHLNAQDIHSGFLNRMYTSRDYEAGLVNLMKERYEVNTVNSS